MAPWLGSVVEAFTLLSAARGQGMAGPGAIPLSEIESCCRLFGIRGPEERIEFATLIQAMDAAYLEVMARRQGGDGRPSVTDQERRPRDLHSGGKERRAGGQR